MTRTNATDLKDVWQTPAGVTEMLRPIDLDPCAGPDTDIGDRNLRKQDDGLTSPWSGRVFVNPPFSDKEAWLRKAVSEQDQTDVVFVLTPDSTDTISWWHEFVEPHADYVWFAEGRVSYIVPETGEPKGSPTFGTAINVFGDPGSDTLDRMARDGHLVKTVRR